MASAFIELEDMPDGTIMLNVRMEGGFQNTSHAHQAAQIMMQMMDTLGERKDDPTELLINEDGTVADVSQNEQATAS